MAHIVNPDNLDDGDDAVFMALLSQGIIWVEEDDEDDSNESEIETLESISEGKARTLNGHTDSINDIAISGDFAISASSDKTLRVWNWQTGQYLRTLSGHTERVNEVVLSGDFAISASSDKTLRVWNWQTGQYLRTLEDDSTHGISALALSAYSVFAASYGDVRIWNWQTGEQLQKQAGWHRFPVLDVAADGDLLLSVSPDLLLVRNWRTGRNLHKLKVSDGSIDESENIALDNEFVIFIDYDRIAAWNWKTGEYLEKPEPHNERYSKIAHRVFSTSFVICLFDARTNKWYLHSDGDPYDDDGMYHSPVTFTGDYSHIMRGDSLGVIHVARVASPLLNLIAGNSVEDPLSANIAGNMSEPTSEYDIDDVLEAARVFVRKRNEKWVNFTRVSQHLHRTFHHLNPKTLGQAGKIYKNLLKLIADYPTEFELRQDPQKQGLYWIRLKRSR